MQTPSHEFTTPISTPKLTSAMETITDVEISTIYNSNEDKKDNFKSSGLEIIVKVFPGTTSTRATILTTYSTTSSSLPPCTNTNFKYSKSKYSTIEIPPFYPIHKRLAQGLIDLLRLVVKDRSI